MKTADSGFSAEFNEFPSEVKAAILDIASEVETNQIWFIGSRANNTARIGSDWDVLVFSEILICRTTARCGCLDVVRVDSLGRYLLEGNAEALVNDFANFRWNRISKDRASYQGVRNKTKAELAVASYPSVLAVACEAKLLFEKELKR